LVLTDLAWARPGLKMVKKAARAEQPRGPGFGPSQVEAKRLLRRFGLRPRKGLGQHFLIDEGVLLHLVSAAELGPEDLVIEVGPGLGILTRELARRAGRVVAIELDAGLASALRLNLASFANISIVNSDVLDIDPAELIEVAQRDAHLLQAPNIAEYKLVANLPYYAAAPIVRHFLEANLKPRLMVFMVQREVGQAMVAQPGHMSLLSVGVQLYGLPSVVGYVSAQSFYPPPKVESVILRISPYKQPIFAVEDTGRFFQLVGAGFSAPRKQLHNSLAQGLGLPASEIAGLLQEANINAQRRAQTLRLEEWAKLWAAFVRSRSN
jgi:16S rRNA (adenine1518-N6/adenine1519-N6)-dimethyltransferase